MRRAVVLMSAQELAWALRLPEGTRLVELRQDLTSHGDVELVIEGDGLPPFFEVREGMAVFRTRRVTTLLYPGRAGESGDAPGH